MANSTPLKITQVGSLRVKAISDGLKRVVTLSDVFVAPHFALRIMMLGRLEK